MLLPLLLSACHRPAPPPPLVANVHFVREPAWQGDGKWFYPQEMTDLDQTGLSTLQPADHPTFTTDGEIYDPTALTAAHQTLQLPAIVTVTNLQNGRQIEVRVDDRGPADPGRIIALSPRAAALLQVPADGVAQVRVVLMPVPTQALAMKLHGGALHLDIATAPEAAVSEESLAPPPGVAQAGQNGAVSLPAQTGHAQAAQVVPDRLPEDVVLTYPDPGQIYIRADTFSRVDYALREAAILSPYGQVLRERHGREEQYSVRGGPYASVAAADAALRSALRLGLRGARITVE